MRLVRATVPLPSGVAWAVTASASLAFLPLLIGRSFAFLFELQPFLFNRFRRRPDAAREDFAGHLLLDGPCRPCSLYTSREASITGWQERTTCRLTLLSLRHRGGLHIVSRPLISALGCRCTRLEHSSVTCPWGSAIWPSQSVSLE